MKLQVATAGTGDPRGICGLDAAGEYGRRSLPAGLWQKRNCRPRHRLIWINTRFGATQSLTNERACAPRAAGFQRCAALCSAQSG
jgi:hypothetical protein